MTVNLPAEYQEAVKKIEVIEGEARDLLQAALTARGLEVSPLSIPKAGNRMANVTKKGSVTVEARKEFGMKGKNQGKFPICHQSAMSALKLCHNGKGVSPAAVVAKVRH